MKKRFLPILVPICLSILLPIVGRCNVNEASLEKLYHQAFKDYNDGELSQAKEKLESILKNEKNSPSVLTNLGLIEYKEGRPGKAIALWRKALNISPNLPQAEKALKFAQKNLKVKELPHKNSLWENLRHSLLITTHVDSYLALTAILMFTSLWLILIYLGQRKEALLNDLSLPSFPYIGTSLFILFIISLALTTLKLIDLQSLRATVIVPKASVLITPKKDSPSIYELFEGLEVIVKQSQGPWVQIQYPGGLSGWIKKENLFYTSGNTP